MKQGTNRSFLASIFLTAFIDMLGVGIIIPIIPAIFYSQDSIQFQALNTPDKVRWTYCLLLASYSFMQFFGAPILGSLSDTYGRKRIIQISLIGQAVGYLLFSVSLYYNNLFVMFLSRMIPGFFGGSLSVLFSAISDVSSPQDKPKNFALIGMAFGLGFIFGPMLGGILSDSTVLPWFALSTPFLFTSVLALINFAWVQFQFNEVVKPKAKVLQINFTQGIKNIYSAFTNPKLRMLFTITFLTTLGFSFFTQFFSIIMFEKFQLTQKTIGLIFGWVGLWLIFTQGFLIRIVTKKFKPESIVSYTLLSLGLSIIALIFPNYIYQILGLNIIIAISQGLNSPNLLTIVSKQANDENQGEIMGINQSMNSFAQFIPPIVVAMFGENLSTFPFVFGGSMIVLAWFIFVFLYKKRH